MTRVRMDVSHSQYWICADDVAEDGSKAIEIARGLATWRPGQVIVTVAAEYSVPIEVEVLEDAPSVSDVDEWQDVVEFSLHTDDGRLHLVPLFDRPRRPNLARHGRGDYRLRLRARDRDSDNGEKELHQLQIWPAPDAPAVLFKQTSLFSANWGAPPPHRSIDWAALAHAPGSRLVVGWRDLTAPPEPQSRDAVTVSAVLTGLTPAAAFNQFTYGNPGGLCVGGGGSSREDHYESAVCSTWSDNDPTGEVRRWVGDLNLVIDQLEAHRFKSLRFEWGFEDQPGELVTLGTNRGVVWVKRPDLAHSHPIPDGSTIVDIAFAKHPDGRLVTVTHHGVPGWLTEDVAAWWAIAFGRLQHTE